MNARDKNIESTKANRRRLNRRAPSPLALEARLMFDGAAVATVVADHPPAEAPVDSAQSTAPASAIDAAVPVTDSAARDTTTTATATPVERHDARQLLAGDPAVTGGKREVAFVDSAINGWTQMAEAIRPGVEVVLIDSQGDGLAEIADYLQGRTDIDAIHIIAHGTDADATFGAVHLTADNVALYQDTLARIGATLATDGDLLLYGCDIGKGAAGLGLIGQLAQSTGADVAASTDATGSASKGGDWVLEAQTGAIGVSTLDLSAAATPDFLLGTPSVTSVDDTTYVEGSGAVIVDSSITVTGGTSYDGKYVRFSVANGQTTDVLSLISAANVNVSGAISISGATVYLGNGSSRDAIGTVDSTENGLAGKALKINFVSTFTNSSFESGLTGWTAMNQMIDLGVTSIAGFTSPTDNTNPSGSGGNDNDVPTTLGTLSTATDTADHTDGLQSLHLSSTGMTTKNGFDVVHGPAVYSDVFSATTGDAIYFDWRAMGGSDAYDVYGYLLNTSTGATTEVLNATGTSSAGSTAWATASASIPTSGTYRFVFVSGTYDFSGGRAAGASLYLDNVRVFGSKVNDTVVTNIARQVAFQATSDNPVTATTRVFSVTALSATGTSGSDTGLINITATNDAPTLTGTAQTLAYTENGAATAIDTAVVVADPDVPANFNGGYLQAQVTGNGAVEDQLSVLNQGTTAGKIGVSGNTVSYGGVTIGTIDATFNGVGNTALKIALNSSATTAATQALARAIAYSNSSDAPSTLARTVTFTLNDGGNTGTGGALSGTRTATVNVTAVDDPAVLTLSRAGASYVENDASFLVDGSLTLTDVDSATLNGAKVVIGSGFKSSEDRLVMAAGAPATISYSYDAAKGVLTLSGTASIADYQAALRAVKYNNLSENPDQTARTITYTLGNAVALTIGGVTHYYEVSSGAASWTAARTAAAGLTYQGLSGYLATITSQAENDFIREKLTADAWIGASDDYTYINAATGTTTYASQAASEGHWYWVTGPEAGTRISDGNGSPVTVSGGYAYWNTGEPNNSGGSEHYGEIYSTGSSPGKWNDLPNTSSLVYVIEYSGSASSSFSKSITVTPQRVNDAPVTTGTVTLTSINENATTNSGQLVSSFLSASDPDTDPVTGIALTSLASGNGTWQYSLDNGATWVGVGTVSNASALLLRTTDRVRFVPDGLNADSVSITYRGWDRTDENASTIKAGQKVDVSTNGGITAYASGTQTGNLTVTAVNDAPVLTPAAPSFASIDEDATSNAGQTVSALLGSSVADVDSGALKGVAITSLNAGNGTWEYSTNGGSTWVAVGTVAGNSALLLRDTDKLRFKPDGNNGTTASISYKAWDQSSGSAASKVDTTVSGGTSAFSTASDTASISVTSVNDAPVLSGAALNFAGISEDNTTNAGQTVASLLGNTLTDVDSGAVQGVAIEAATVAGTGHWEYSTNSGTSWTSFPALSTSTALLLQASDKIRFVPDALLGGTATLTVRGWDRTSGAPGTTADTTTKGGTTAFSLATATASIAVASIDDAPSFADAGGTPALPTNKTFSEAATGTAASLSAATAVDTALLLRDDGTGNSIKSASISISGGFTAGDVLACDVGETGISASYSSNSGVLTLSGNSTVANYQAVLRSVTFKSTSEDPTVNSTTRTLSWRVTDTTNLSSSPVTSLVTLTPTADAPVLAAAPATWTYTEDDGTRVVAPSLTLTDVDDTQLSGATVTLSGTGYLTDGRELLAATVTGTGITTSFDATTGVLTLSGTDSVANYQKVLRSVTYTNTGDYENPANVVNNLSLAGNDTRSIEWQVTDANSDGVGAQSSTIATTALTIQNANEVPQVSNVNGGTVHISYVEGGAAGTLEGALVVQDDGIASTINSAFVRVTAGLEAGDQLGFFSPTVGAWTRTGSATSGTLDDGAGKVIGYVWDLASGDLMLTTQSGTTNQADYTSVMEKVGFVSASDDPTASSGTRTLIWRVTDSGGLQSAVTAAQTSIVDITAVNDTASVSSLPAGGDITYVEDGATVALAPALTLADPDDTTLASATVVISGAGFDAAHEYLSVPGASVLAGSDWSQSNVGGTGINASFDHATGTLTLTGSASMAAYQTVLRQVAYGSDADNPTAVAVTRDISWTLTDSFGSRLTDADGGGNNSDSGSAGATATSTVTLAPRNDAPTIGGVPGATASYTEGAAAATLAAGITLADVDDASLTAASVWISSGFTAGDTLSVAVPGGLTSSYDAATGILTLSGTASKAVYEAALQSVTYASTSADPTAIAPSRTLSWQVTDGNASGDGALSSAIGNTSLDITATDNPGSVGGLPSSGAIGFTENGSPVVVAPALTLSDADDTTLVSAQVQITGGLTSGDVLALSGSFAGITGSYSGGILTLTGPASIADFQAALRAVTFNSSSDNPTGTAATRTLSWTTVSAFTSRLTDAAAGNDGATGSTSSAVTSQVNLTALNDAPLIALDDGTVSTTDAPVFEQGSAAVYAIHVGNTAGGVTITDPDLGDSIAGASVVISTNRLSTDTLSVATPAGWTLTGSTFSKGSASVGFTYNSGSGTLTLTGTASRADYEELLGSVKFANSSVAPTASGASRELTWTVTDSNTAGDGARSATTTSQLVIRDRNDAPTVVAGAPSASYTEGAASVALPTLTVTDPDPGEIITATLTVSHPAAGTLSVPAGASYDPGTGIWTFTGSVANVNAALAAVSFQPATDNDQAVTVSYSIADGGEDGAVPATGSLSLNVTAVNDAPVLTPVNPVLPGLTEDQTGSAGFSVASFRGSVSDVDTGAVAGIAISGLNSGNGTWQYSLDSGSSWINVGSVSASSSLVLRDSDLLRFVPDGHNATTASLAYRAWDTTGGAAGSKLDASSSGNATPFSSAIDTASITVTAVNDAPVLATATPSLPTLTEDDSANAGQTVATLLGASVGDVDSGAQQGIAITGLNAGNGAWEYSLDGGSTWNSVGSVSAASALLLRDTDLVRFHPDAKNATTASFDYKAWDRSSGSAGGHGDTTVVDATGAFSATGNTAAITVTAVNDAPVIVAHAPVMATLTEDQTGNAGQTVASLLGASVSDVDSGAQQGIAVTGLSAGNGGWEYSLDGGTTWLSLAAPASGSGLLLRDTDRVRFVPDGNNATTASLTYLAWDRTAGTPGSSASTAATGGSSMFSAGQDTASITVTAVNDAPVLAAAAPSLPTLTEDDTANVGQSVASLLGGTVSDADSGAQQGIAITGLNAGNGAWEYSLDGGSTWNSVGSVSAASALLLRDTDLVRFHPDAKNATTASFDYKAWDRSSGSAGGHGDTTSGDPTGSFSLTGNTAAITVTAVNDAPINDVAPSFSGGARGDGTLRQDGVLTANPELWHDVDAGDPATTFQYQWQVADDAAGTNLRNISGATALNYMLTAGEIGKFVRVKVTGSDGQAETVAYSGFTEVSNLDPVLSSPLDVQNATQSVPLSITLPANTFTDGNAEDTLYYKATLADGSPLPAWLSFDPATRTFTGTPGGGDIAVLSIRVTASDHGKNDAQMDFTLRVLGLPVKQDDAAPPLPPPAAPLAPNTDLSTPVVTTPGTFIRTAGNEGLNINATEQIGNPLSTPIAPPAPIDVPRDTSPIAQSAPQGGLTRSDGFQVVVAPPAQSNDISLLLARPLSNQEANPAEPIRVVVPPDTFTHTQRDAVITLSASRTDGLPMPSWLRFDAQKGVFQGVAPAGYEGDFEVKVNARDNFGNEVSTIFRFVVKPKAKVSFSGRDGLSAQIRAQSGLGGMLRLSGADRLVSVDKPAEAPAKAVPRVRVVS